ncbi:extracellular catalytic domain type 1 short-chain-length polyhydroxyalkanoate depolymerase [Caenimonas aquaedulcis]|uniref:extracellular catalytic domain type 1 short-chain-length polyhydroxyalkanoate depolymerase n=1 Tax=Caenimonas aquaedulcis TaxID=2793270 RepID=UPI001E3A8829|nr:PHB depolymerase family esterase [Caenimonas aquaedulcis]
MYIPLEELAKATELTRGGRLQEATQLIQQALQRGAPAGEKPAPAPTPSAPRADVTDVTDVAFRELPSPGGAPAAAAEQPSPASSTGPASFERHAFDGGAKPYTYWLYTPGRQDDSAPLPIVVMLHGCTQDGADFATGTAMNELAAVRGCLVVYPEQRQDANSMRCWNWFEPAHQRRDSGEPAMIAALALEVAARHGGDTSRIYIAGLSAGGAMATLVGQLYPDVFAAVGVHSGLPAQSAQDVVGAMSAMRKPAAQRTPSTRAGIAVPTIVFHGNSDRTVHPGNGKRIVQEAVSAADAKGVPLSSRPGPTGASSRTVRRAVHSSAEGQPWVESWEIVGAPHAWSGGRAAGTYTDPQGPDASAAMLDFFLQHRLATQRPV